MSDIENARARKALEEGVGGDPANVARYIVNQMATQDPPVDAIIVVGVWRKAGRTVNVVCGRAGIAPHEMVGVLELAKLKTFLDDELIDLEDG